MRCFVALDLPRPVQNHVAKVAAPLRERFDLKWVRPEQMHATLLFAGELPPEHVDALADELDRLELPATAPQLALDRFGVFPPKGIPRVVWVGLGGQLEPVVAVHERLEAFARTIDVPRDKRPFTPHLTVARLKTQFGALALIDRLEELSAELRQKPFAAEAVTLYESTLTPSGPRYEVVHRRWLDGA